MNEKNSSVGGVRRLWGGFCSKTANAGQNWLNLVYPPQCVCCFEEINDFPNTSHLCEKCRTLFLADRGDFCIRCGWRFENEENREFLVDCPNCRDADIAFNHVWALGDYHQSLRDVILRMKNANQGALAYRMGRFLAERFVGELKSYKPDLILPVPMFFARRLLRGMNSPEVAAEGVADVLHIPMHRWTLWRMRPTRPQWQMTPSQRLTNVKGAFAVWKASWLQGAKILLVDDVLTTGATCHEVSKVLCKAGAASVAVVVIARAQGKDGACIQAKKRNNGERPGSCPLEPDGSPNRRTDAETP